jgi:hypothetical protein
MSCHPTYLEPFAFHRAAVVGGERKTGVVVARRAVDFSVLYIRGGDRSDVQQGTRSVPDIDFDMPEAMGEPKHV